MSRPLMLSRNAAPILDVDEMLGMDMAPDPNLFADPVFEITPGSDQIALGSYVDAISEQAVTIQSKLAGLGIADLFRENLEAIFGAIERMDSALIARALVERREARRG